MVGNVGKRLSSIIIYWIIFVYFTPELVTNYVLLVLNRGIFNRADHLIVHLQNYTHCGGIGEVVRHRGFEVVKESSSDTFMLQYTRLLNMIQKCD